MIHPALKAIHCPDVPDLPNFHPTNSESFGFLLQLFVGPPDQEGMESFDVMVCSPQWLTDQYAKDAILIMRHYLIVFEYNYERLLNRINQYLGHCAAETWPEVARKVGRLGKWEFEDYQEVRN